MSEICQKCNRTFPPELVREMAIGEEGRLHYELMCPLCALEIINNLHGLPKGTPFRGRLAATMYANAVAHLEKTNQ